MKIINHECYISLEVAKLLKKAGFDWERETCYIGKSGRPYKYHKFFNWNMPKKYFEKYGSDNLFHAFITQKKTNSFISAPTLEVARTLKEKGYRQRYHAYYFGDSNLRKGGYRGDSWYNSPDFYPAPTKSEVIDWLESKGIVVEIQYNQESRTWSYSIYCIIYMSSDEEFSTLLEAEEAAIIKACKLLENGN